MRYSPCCLLLPLKLSLLQVLPPSVLLKLRPGCLDGSTSKLPSPHNRNSFAPAFRCSTGIFARVHPVETNRSSPATFPPFTSRFLADPKKNNSAPVTPTLSR